MPGARPRAALPVQAETLEGLTLFRRLAPEDRERLAHVALLRRYEKGELLFAEGDPSDLFFLVIRGRVKVYKSTPAGKDVILEIFGPGEPLGAVAVYERRPFPASAEAMEPSACLTIPTEAFLGLLERHPSLTRGLLAALTLRLVELTNRLAELTGGRVEPRFARLFLNLADRIGRTEGGGVEIPLPLSRQELADLTGTTIETCIRIMSRWGKDGTVETRKDGFVIRDRAALETLALS